MTFVDPRLGGGGRLVAGVLISSLLLASVRPALAQPAPATPASPQPAPVSAGEASPVSPAPQPVAPAHPGLPPQPAPAPTTVYVAMPSPQSAPTYLHYDEGQPIPPGYYLEERYRRGLVISGALVFGIPYGLGLSIASGDKFDNQKGWLVVPVLGPLMTSLLREERCWEDEFDYGCPDDEGARIVLTMDFLMQATGATLLILGLSSKVKRLVRVDVTRSFEIQPIVFADGSTGIGASGRF